MKKLFLVSAAASSILPWAIGATVQAETAGRSRVVCDIGRALPDAFGAVKGALAWGGVKADFQGRAIGSSSSIRLRGKRSVKAPGTGGGKPGSFDTLGAEAERFFKSFNLNESMKGLDFDGAAEALKLNDTLKNSRMELILGDSALASKVKSIDYDGTLRGLEMNKSIRGIDLDKRLAELDLRSAFRKIDLLVSTVQKPSDLDPQKLLGILDPDGALMKELMGVNVGAILGGGGLGDLLGQGGAGLGDALGGLDSIFYRTRARYAAATTKRRFALSSVPGVDLTKWLLDPRKLLQGTGLDQLAVDVGRQFGLDLTDRIDAVKSDGGAIDFKKIFGETDLDRAIVAGRFRNFVPVFGGKNSGPSCSVDVTVRVLGPSTALSGRAFRVRVLGIAKGGAAGSANAPRPTSTPKGAPKSKPTPEVEPTPSRTPTAEPPKATPTPDDHEGYSASGRK